MLTAIRRNLGALVTGWVTSQFERPRAALLAQAHGTVADIGIGDGASLKFYPQAVERVIGIEPEPAEWLLRRRMRAVGDRFAAELLPASGLALPFADASLDIVTFQLVLCTIPEPATALAEARRVLKPGGKLLFLEHVRHDDPKVAAFQDRYNAAWGRIAGGCRINQDTAALIADAGFTFEWRDRRIDRAKPRFLSHVIWGAATPSGRGR